MTTTGWRQSEDLSLKARALAVIPGGMFGHQSTARLPASYPQFFERAEGCRLWDCDGNEYIDFLCSYGPIVLGHRHPAVERAAALQQARGDCMTGPSARLVELAELLVDTVAHADWALFQKNGTDATTLCVSLARAETGKRKILVAKGAYHGAAPWCTPSRAGVTPEDRANLLFYAYNDGPSVEAAADEAGDDLAGIVVSAFKHDVMVDQELPDPSFARDVRQLCDRTGAALILDDVRAGFRLHLGGSWETVGVRPDLSAWSKAVANGYPLAAVLGTDRFREVATKVFATGSFWCGSVPMAAAIATITELREADGLARMEAAGSRFRAGLAAQAEAHGFEIRQTGPAQMPLILFADDPHQRLGARFTEEALCRGVYLHPWHNMFLTTAHTDEDIDDALARTDEAFAALARAPDRQG
jgi:glutamate-1-semialdehyde 2,1-aminomutase